ncbi:Uncharacterised protein [Vibrio cholerae]|nr:Uncharacterised protein [Vibrio cholerae]
MPDTEVRLIGGVSISTALLLSSAKPQARGSAPLWNGILS